MHLHVRPLWQYSVCKVCVGYVKDAELVLLEYFPFTPGFSAIYSLSYSLALGVNVLEITNGLLYIKLLLVND